MSQNKTIFSSRGSSQYSCIFCSLKLADQISLKHHVEDVHKGRTFLCSNCGAQLRFHANLSKHKHVTCLNTRFIVCYFPEKARIPKASPDTKCPTCFLIFPNSVLKRHHFEEFHCQRRFHCNFCHQVVVSHRDLLAHVHQHNNDNVTFEAKYAKRPQHVKSMPLYKCPHCGGLFSHAGNLMRHKRIVHSHTRKPMSPKPSNTLMGSRRFLCLDCGRRVNDKVAHKRGSHPNESITFVNSWGPDPAKKKKSSILSVNSFSKSFPRASKSSQATNNEETDDVILITDNEEDTDNEETTNTTEGNGIGQTNTETCTLQLLQSKS